MVTLNSIFSFLLFFHYTRHLKSSHTYLRSGIHKQKIPAPQDNILDNGKKILDLLFSFTLRSPSHL